MPITINKNSGASVLTINNFSNLTVDGNTPYTSIADLLDAEDKAILLKADGATMLISFDYTIMGEPNGVVSGTGSPVTTAIGQFKYLFNTLMSKGSASHTDKYTLVLEYSTTALDSGTATSGTSTTLADTSKNWTVNAYSDQVVKLTGGTGSGQIRNISSNTGGAGTSALTVSDAWDTNPDATTTYQIIDGFSRKGEIVRVTAKMSSDQPLTFVGSITFSVGTNPMT